MESSKIRDFLRCHACNSDPGGVCPDCLKKFMSNEWEQVRRQLSPQSQYKKKLHFSSNITVDTGNDVDPSVHSIQRLKDTPSRIELSRDVRRLRAEKEALLQKLNKFTPTGTKQSSESTRKEQLRPGGHKGGIFVSNKGKGSPKIMHVYLYDNYGESSLDREKKLSNYGKTQRLLALQFWETLINSDSRPSATILMGDSSVVEGKLCSINSNQSEILVKEMKTPQFEYPSAVLRSSDVDCVDLNFELNDQQSSAIEKIFRESQSLNVNNTNNVAEMEIENALHTEVSIEYNSEHEKRFDNPDGEHDVRKYWSQRFRYFSRFDDGIKTDAQGLFSVTPEAIAHYVANSCSCDVIVDGFCGIGGNAIRFATTCKRVIAIDIDPTKIEYAKHNARVYDVHDKIEFIVGDFFQICSSITADAVFLAPPWGGPKYEKLTEGKIEYILNDTRFSKCNKNLIEAAQNVSQNIAILLPKYANVKDLRAHSGIFHKLEYHYLNGKVKSACIYAGNLSQNSI